MIHKDIELGALRLTSEQDKLQLSISGSGTFRLPEWYSAAKDQQIVQELVSGGLWATRGAQCHLNLSILIDGKVAEGSRSFQFIEAIAYRLRNAPVSLRCFSGIYTDSIKLWNQLSLSTAVTVHHISTPEESNPQITIAINHGPRHQLASGAHPQTDIRPPDSVFHAEFMALRIVCDFSKLETQPKVMLKALPSSPPLNDLRQNKSAKSKTTTDAPPTTPVSQRTLQNQTSKTKRKRNILPKTPLSQEIKLIDVNLVALQSPTQFPMTPANDSSGPSNAIAELLSVPTKPKSTGKRKARKQQATSANSDPFIKQENGEDSGLSAGDMSHNLNNKRQKAFPDTPTPKVAPKQRTQAATKQNHDLIKKWVEENRANTYPAKIQMDGLLKSTGYSRSMQSPVTVNNY